MAFSASELILNADGSIYHLNLHPDDIADTIMVVGDPDRVPAISRHFDSIEVKKTKREFVTHTGHLGGRRFTVLSTGIGTGNIDIVLNELDALANIADEGNAEAIAAVAARLEDACADVRKAAADALANIADKGNAEAIAAVVARL